MEIISISDKNRGQINDFLISHWYSTDMVVRGEVVDMMRIYRNALEKSRKIKPSIPMTGDFDIPLKHEIEFERKIEHHADINH